MPLRKRGRRHDGDHCRGVNLTNQISKVLERVLGLSFLSFLHCTLAFGPHRFAYLPGRGARDVTAYLLMIWIIGFDALRKFGPRCSHVPGAVDKVSRQKLIRKLSAKGLHDTVLDLLQSWPRPCAAHVVVDGATSDAMTLEDMVFQGTVWGPPLWNVFSKTPRSQSTSAVSMKSCTRTILISDVT